MRDKLMHRLAKCISPDAVRNVYPSVGKSLFSIGVISILLGWYVGIFISPIDYQQKETVYIMYVHVPAAILSMMVYSCMALYSLIYLVWRIKIYDKFAQVSAYFGCVATIIALGTGALWGKPMWGTWWIWDARLTSELILLFIYMGYIWLQSSSKDSGNKFYSAAFCIFAWVDIPIIHYSVNWWFTLHQGESIRLVYNSTIAAEFLIPLLVTLFGSIFLYFGYMLAVTAKEARLGNRSTKTVQVNFSAV